MTSRKIGRRAGYGSSVGLVIAFMVFDRGMKLVPFDIVWMRKHRLSSAVLPSAELMRRFGMVALILQGAAPRGHQPHARHDPPHGLYGRASRYAFAHRRPASSPICSSVCLSPLRLQQAPCASARVQALLPLSSPTSRT